MCVDTSIIETLVRDISLLRPKLEVFKKLRIAVREDEESQRCLHDAGGVVVMTALLTSALESGEDFEKDG